MEYLSVENTFTQTSKALIAPSSKIAQPKIGAIMNFHPDIWGNFFLDCIPDDEVTQAQKVKQMEELKEEVKRELEAHMPSKQLQFIDALQRLGIAYYFENEITNALQEIYIGHAHGDDDLYYSSLRFRLLRQSGFYVSTDIFKKFRDKKGNFKESIIGDVMGMLSLYEASHLKVHGEEIMNEALKFATSHLQSIAIRPSDPLEVEVTHALKHPIYKNMEWLESRWYIFVYEHNSSHNTTLLKLAKLNFNLLQSLHKKELHDLVRWWRRSNIINELPYVRDRVVEAYFFSLAMYYEPRYSRGRIAYTQLFKIITLIDDTYDNCTTTIEDLELFTEAIQRLDINYANKLPNYMKIIYQFTLETLEEIEQDLAKDGRSFCINYTRDELKSLSRAYLQESRWASENYTPTYEERLENGIASSAVSCVLFASFLGMGEITTKESLESIYKNFKAMKAACVIGRLKDDIGDYEVEHGREYVANAVKCYMKDYASSKEKAIEEICKLIDDAWMHITEEILGPTTVPMPLLVRILNFSRSMETIYTDSDNYTVVGQAMKDYIKMLLIEPIHV
ncbi:hypothetical protein Nepgr_031458 [Nepenthes gracilis]|uniref:Uncharacterized protein n=1 Tax=Nepenthes gracilis TaxID=150966 RepID=A0AAD3TGR7_NEPGR|nr:hypothetical protein Nepgr_031458 [Nepenthes gracilis]